MFYGPMSGVQLSYDITQAAYYTHDPIQGRSQDSGAPSKLAIAGYPPTKLQLLPPPGFSRGPIEVLLGAH
jgi:hypothetical protein